MVDTKSNRPKRVIVIVDGKPGCGKSTCLSFFEGMLCEESRLSMKSFDCSVVLKKSGNPQVINKMNQGVMLEDELVIDVMTKELVSTDFHVGVLSGFPRTSLQRDALVDLCSRWNESSNCTVHIVSIVCADEICLQRMNMRAREDSAHNRERISSYKNITETSFVSKLQHKEVAVHMVKIVNELNDLEIFKKQMITEWNSILGDAVTRQSSSICFDQSEQSTLV